MNAIIIAAALTSAVQTNPLIDNDTRGNTTIIVFDNGAIDATPIRTVAASQESRDRALAHAFADARGQCNGEIRQMGFDTHEIPTGFAAELYFTCHNTVDLTVY